MATVCKSHFLSNGPLMAQSWGTLTVCHESLSRENFQLSLSVNSCRGCATAMVAAKKQKVSSLVFIIPDFMCKNTKKL